MNKIFQGKPNADIENYIISKFPLKIIYLNLNGQNLLITGPGRLQIEPRSISYVEQKIYPYGDAFIIAERTENLKQCKVFVNDVLRVDYDKYHLTPELKYGDIVRLEYSTHWVTIGRLSTTGQIVKREEGDSYRTIPQIWQAACIFKSIN